MQQTNVKPGDLARVIGKEQLVESLALVNVISFDRRGLSQDGQMEVYWQCETITHVRAARASKSVCWDMVPPGELVYAADSILRKWGGPLEEGEVKKLYTSLSKPGAEKWATRPKTTTTKVN